MGNLDEGICSGVPNSQTDEDLQSAKFISALIAGLILLVYACGTHRKWIEPTCKQAASCGQEVFLRLAICIAIVTGFWLAARHVWFNTTTFRTNWWNINGKLGKPSWEDVLNLTVNNDNDPLNHPPEPNWICSILRMIFAYVFLGCVLIEFLTLLYNGPIMPLLLSNEAPGNNGLNANLTALLALLAAAISIHFTYRQLQAKVRANSRQAWINKLRSKIAGFIALADDAHSTALNRSKRKDLNEFTKRRIEMELLLNPSERDHRMLMYLSLRLAFFSRGECEFLSIQDVKNIRKAIGMEEGKPVPDKWKELFGPIPSRGDPIAYRSAYSDLIGYTLRLAHVVLKREWEQVKATR